MGVGKETLVNQKTENNKKLNSLHVGDLLR
jgi:hypothetical protein